MPVVVTLPPLRAAAFVARLVKLSTDVPVPPTTPPNVVVPLSLTISAWFALIDFTVLEKLIPVPVNVVSALSTTASL